MQGAVHIYRVTLKKRIVPGISVYGDFTRHKYDGPLTHGQGRALCYVYGSFKCGPRNRICQCDCNGLYNRVASRLTEKVHCQDARQRPGILKPWRPVLLHRTLRRRWTMQAVERLQSTLLFSLCSPDGEISPNEAEAGRAAKCELCSIREHSPTPTPTLIKAKAILTPQTIQSHRTW